VLALALATSAMTIAACDGPTKSDAVGVGRNSVTYMETFAASAGTKLSVPAAATWGVNDTNGVIDPDTHKLSERLDFDLLDASGQLLYRGVLVIPDASLKVSDSDLSQYLAWGIGKNGVDLDPMSNEAQLVLGAFRSDAGLQPAE
jgi:hypothetical protein